MTRSGIFLLVWLLLAWVPLAQAGESAGVIRTEAEIMRLGEQMYRDGLLPSGEPMEAFIRGDIEVDSTAFSCSSCHLRAGLGSYEGGVVTPPTTGRKLYQPYQRPPSLSDTVDPGGRYIYAKTIIQRPAYTRETLAHALRTGIDPAGEEFNDVMPRYPLADDDMELMIQYLDRLSATYSPGAGEKMMRYATIITSEVSREDREALLVPLQRFINVQNQQVKLFQDFKKFGFTPTGDMRFAFRNASLSIWELKGEPSTWEAQLAEYYRKDPVFAILGGISYKDWQPIHNFCEKVRLPCLFPITDLPVVSKGDWYTIYYNKGYYQEGEGTARYLHRNPDLTEKGRILQLVVDSPAGRALAEGFNQTRSELQQAAVTTITLKSEELQNRDLLKTLLKQNRSGILLLWGDATILPVLPTLAAALDTPARIFVSSTALGKSTTRIEESLRAQTSITFPYRLTPYVGGKEGSDARVPQLTTADSLGKKRIDTRTMTMLIQAALQGLRQLEDNLYQDHLLDVMSMQMDQIVPDYERLSFGPGQRYASKGCYIIQLGPGEQPELIKQSEWVTH